MRRIDAAGYPSRDLGLLVIRIVIGSAMAVLHGYDKIAGGTEMWTRVGGAMAHYGITFLPAFWGFLAAFAEFFASIFLVLGFLFRPAAALLAITMLVAATVHLRMPAGAENAGWSGASHALELLSVYVGLFLTGPGKYALGLLGRR